MKKLLLLTIFLLLSLDSFCGIAVVPTKDADGNIISVSDSFSAKNGYLFRGTGKSFTAAASTTTVMEYTLTYNHAKFNGLEIINGQVGDSANLKVLDTPTGAYTYAQLGTAIPNAVLNQFGFNWYLTDYMKEKLPYVSDLYVGMRIVIEYTNNSASPRTIYINYYLHEDQ